MITAKDWLIINTALAFYESNMEGSDDDECTRLNFLAESHKQQFGDIDKTINATRRRVHQMIQKKGIQL